MKRLHQTLYSVALCVLLAITGIFAITGCRTGGEPATKEAVVFMTFRTSFDTAQEAYKQVHKLDLQGKLAPGKMQEVTTKWLIFRNAHRTAFLAATRDWSAATPADVLKLRDELLQFIRSL